MQNQANVEQEGKEGEAIPSPSTSRPLSEIAEYHISELKKLTHPTRRNMLETKTHEET